jgi:pimeloyl-ACP methyl ester carboxylesterase
VSWMLLQGFAETLDRAFIHWGLRPNLPEITPASRLEKLLLAEQRTRVGINDAELFPKQCMSLTPPTVPLQRQWGPSGQACYSTFSRWYVRSAARPLVMLVSGWSPVAGIDSTWFWPRGQLYRSGFDVVLLQPHGKALGTRRTRAAKFPSRDPSLNIIELARAANALLQHVHIARERGYQRISLCGTSLGAHLVGLVATMPECNLIDRFILDKPVGRLSDPIRWHARGDRALLCNVAERLDRVYRFVCPLDRSPTADTHRIDVIGAIWDQVVPLRTAQSVADHFQVPLRQIKASHLFDPYRSQRLLRLLQHG